MTLITPDLLTRVNAVLAARDKRPRPTGTGRPGLRMQAAGDGTTDVLLYDEIGFWGITAADIVAVLGDMKGDINLKVNSPGGDVFDGIAIYNALADHPGQVTVTIDGLAASAASFISMAGNRIVMNRASQMMIHDASGLCIGDAGDMHDMAALLDRVSDTIAGIYADRTSTPADTWRNVMRGEQWFNASEAIAAKLADAMAPGRRDEDEEEEEREGEGEREETKVTYDLTVFQFAGREHAPAPIIQATAVGPHESSAKEGEWSRSANESRLPSPVPLATARKFYAAWDESRVEDGAVPKGAGHLPHHFVGEDGTPGAASISGVQNALARLNQTHGLSESERGTVERHLRGHLPAEKKSDDKTTDGGMPAAPEPDEWAAQVAHMLHPSVSPIGDLLANLREAK